MPNYCCFNCPENDYEEKSLHDLCPSCSREFGFPLFDRPIDLRALSPYARKFKILEPLGRGFYAATYLAESGALNIKSVLKISPKRIYEFFDDKDFEQECQIHQQVARGTEHIVNIRDMFDAEVAFGKTEIKCHVAELDFIHGETLADILETDTGISATRTAQIAIDLFKIRDELMGQQVNHNDLHAANIVIETLRRDVRRTHAIDGSIRAVAIDLGSVSNISKSDSYNSRLGDLHWIAEHLSDLVKKLLRNPHEISDQEYRLASALQTIVKGISPSAENQRTPQSSDIIEQIEEAYTRVTQHWRPWREPLILKSFNASYNAQTMRAWHVPQLLVDPQGRWLHKICSPGPQVITGMRGCGKTMLLRAAQFHARAAIRGDESQNAVLNRLKKDNYVGLFVSAQRLLDTFGKDEALTTNPFARLFIAYALAAVRAILHLSDIDGLSVSRHAQQRLTDAISNNLEHSIDIGSAHSLIDLERRINRVLISLSQGDGANSLTAGPYIAFTTLAESLLRCSQIWQGAQVLYLLDDVSTRYLNQPRIEELLSELLFQSPLCAFKLTSEAQTIKLGLTSPVKIHPAREGRDLSFFDLGAEVYEKIKKRGPTSGWHFVEDILRQRARHFQGHPEVSPSSVLGNTTLESIARTIGRSQSGSKQRKSIYHGITALSLLCVGDIGDVISLYEQILKNSEGSQFPVSPKIQSECFQDFSARRIYDLNRRGGFLKDVAKSFAEASHFLLMKSCNEPRSTVVRRRIRQYTSLYVRITAGDRQFQIDRLRELIDAGVFVFAGGSNVPRSKTRDSNPIQQFKLTYRKIYGLVNFIGLAERDRFELSGADLEEWLTEPRDGKELLLRNLRGSTTQEERDVNTLIQPLSQDPSISDQNLRRSSSERVPRQISLFQPSSQIDSDRRFDQPVSDSSDTDVPADKIPVIEKLDSVSIDATVDWVVIGLGFEDRTASSARRLCSAVNPVNAVAVGYAEPSGRRAVGSVLNRFVRNIREVQYRDIVSRGLHGIDGNVMVDITGLAKPVIFHVIRSQLLLNGRVWLCHTEAESYYPLDTDLREVLRARELRDYHTFLDEMRLVLTGEKGPYTRRGLLVWDSDDTRQTACLLFSSPKHERMFSLLDVRDYDRIEIVSSKGRSNRSMVAGVAAEIAARDNANSEITNIGSNDIHSVMDFIANRYYKWYIHSGLNFELGLTGSKLQAVACAAASAAFKVSQCWYLEPARFDPSTFTCGVGKTTFYKIVL